MPAHSLKTSHCQHDATHCGSLVEDLRSRGKRDFFNHKTSRTKDTQWNFDISDDQVSRFRY